VVDLNNLKKIQISNTNQNEKQIDQNYRNKALIKLWFNKIGNFKTGNKQAAQAIKKS